VPRDAPGAVLFACTMNAVRSPMAAAILSHLIGRRVRVASAGVKHGDPDPYAVAVMDEIGIDISEHEPCVLADLGDATFDLIVTLSPEAHHHAIELTRTMAADVEHWPTLDATASPGTGGRDEALERYRKVRDQLFARIKARFMPESGPTV
jgi:protein-tyrosine-phosphatase